MTSKQTLRDTNDFLNSISKKKKDLPTSVEMIYYILVTEMGLSLIDIVKLPLPYLFGLLKAHHYVKKKEEQEAKKAQKK